jgi:hypothetical protein
MLKVAAHLAENWRDNKTGEIDRILGLFPVTTQHAAKLYN